LVGQALVRRDRIAAVEIAADALVVLRLAPVRDRELELDATGGHARRIGEASCRAQGSERGLERSDIDGPLRVRYLFPRRRTLMIQMTEKAVGKVKELLSAEDKAGFGLRVAIHGGGCSGFQYGLTFENAEKPNDQILEFGGLKVYVDAMSGMYLDGVKIDYVDSLDGSGFKIDNPNASGTCGCGHSFQA
jgi:iron-sulfur cluster assembly accessory protein